MKKLFLLLFFSTLLLADIVLEGHLHPGDNEAIQYMPSDPLTFNYEHTYDYYLNNPTNFYLSQDVNVTGVELLNAQYIESDSNIRVYIDGNLIATGNNGSATVLFDSPLSLQSGFHTIAVRGSCYRWDGREINCNRSNVSDIDDFTFGGYRLISDQNSSAIQFIQRRHIGDTVDYDYCICFKFYCRCFASDDNYDDLQNDNNMPFYYPDAAEGASVSYDFTTSCMVDQLKIYFFRLRDVHRNNLNEVKIYQSNQLVANLFINVPNLDLKPYDINYTVNISEGILFTNGRIEIVSGNSSWNDKDDISWDELIIVPHCKPPSNNFKTFNFNAVSSVGNDGNCNANDDWENNLTTQIANQGYDLYILSKNSDTSQADEANITKVELHYYTTGDTTRCSGSSYETQLLCKDDTSSPCPDTNQSGCMHLSVTTPKAVKCVQVYIEGRDINATTNDVNESNSSDDYAVRPKYFLFAAPPTGIKAGRDFNITLYAKDATSSNTLDYTNISVNIRGSSVDLEYNETKAGCKTGTLVKVSEENFSDGVAQMKLRYDETGELNLTLQEVNGSEFAKVDRDDTNDSTRLIEASWTTLRVIPHHFKVNATLQDFDTDTNFTYLSRDLNMSARIDINITAQNEQNKTTENFIKECYASDVNISLSHTPVQREALHSLLYILNDANDTNRSFSIEKNASIEIEYNETNFSTANKLVDQNGTTVLRLYINFDRNQSAPVSPFELNITDINVTNGDATSEGYEDIEGNATFYYGRVYVKDLSTEQTKDNTTAIVLFYDDNLSDGVGATLDANETLIDWYVMKKHKDKDGNISQAIPKSGFELGSQNLTNLTVTTSFEDGNGTYKIDIANDINNPVKSAYIHIDIPSWLWYSYSGVDYSFENSSDCTQHPCIHYRYMGQKGNIVKSGETRGVHFEQNISNEKRGVRIFR